MTGTENVVLQITDEVTARRCAIRIRPDEATLALGQLLDRYLKGPPIDQLLAEHRVTRESADILFSIQDLVYALSDDGRLHDMLFGVEFRSGPVAVSLDDAIDANTVVVEEKHVDLLDLVIDRTNVGYDRNWVGFHRRRWQRDEDAYSDFVREVVEERVGVANCDQVMALESTARKTEFVEAIAHRIWESDFENYSRFVGRKLRYKTGDETLRNIMEGSGGICSEKVQALKFVTDHYGLESEYVAAGAAIPGPVPEDKLRELLTTFDFRFAKRHMRYWQHTALLYTFDAENILVDDTNGNIPFLFARNGHADALLGYTGKKPVRVRMAVNDEEFYYHRVSPDIMHNLYFAMEGWIPDIDLVQVFDNELGLFISGEFMVTPIVYRTGEGFDKLREQYLKVCGDAGLDCSALPTWDLESRLAQRFAERDPTVAERIIAARDHLLDRYDESHGSGHEGGLVVIGLNRN